MQAPGWRAEPGVATKPPGEVLIVKPSSLGDIVHTLPCAALLRAAFPSASIRWVANTEWMPLLEGNPHIDEAIEFPRRHFRGTTGFLRFAAWLRTLRARVAPDLILDFQGLLRSALISKTCRRPATRVLGLGDAREGSRFFYDHDVDVSHCEHAVDRYLALTRSALHNAGQAPAASPLEWPLPVGSRPAGLPDSAPFVLLHPFSRGNGKSLSARQVSEFCQALGDHPIVIAGRATASVEAGPNVINLLNQTTLSELIWLLRQARFIVSVDSGPMHIAAALTSRLISIHTWSDPAKVGPYREEAWVWQNERLFRQAERNAPESHRPITDLAALAHFVRSQL